MQSSPKKQDVVVIGGGPAGSTVATLLARRGRRVTVLEKERFPRDHVGESLLPFCYSIFQELGVLEVMEERYVRKPGVRFVDSDGATATTWCFDAVIKDPSFLSFHVFRGDFDRVLLDNARREGARVREETRVLDVDLERADGLVEVRAARADGEVETYPARFLVDASGRDTLLGTRMRWKKPYEGLDRAALSTHWIGAEFGGGLAEGLLQIVYLGGEKKGWIWVIPIGHGRVSVGVVLDHAYIRSERARLVERGVEDWKTELYCQELMLSPFVRRTLAEARIVMPMMFNGDYSYVIERKYGPNFALIGDASAFIDPIFATGVYLGMNSARLVAGAIDAKLTSGAAASDALFEEAYSQINGAYGLVDRTIRLFYNPMSVNFAQAGSAAPLLHQDLANALALGHYLLAGDFFERHRDYHRFIDLLQEPKMFRRYKKLVIDRKESQAASCAAGLPDVFPPVDIFSDRPWEGPGRVTAD